MSITPDAIEAARRAYDAQRNRTECDQNSCLKAALAAAMPYLLPPTHVLVPKEPTEEMLSAGDSMMPQIADGEYPSTGYDALLEAWPAMLEAAPKTGVGG